MSRRLVIAAATLVATVSAAAAAPASGGHAATARILSNETTLTRWARAVRRAPIYREPSRLSPLVARLHFMTEDLQPETYLLLVQRTNAAGEWVKIRIPMRPNGRTGWVLRDDLGPFKTVRTRIVVDEKHLRATLYRRGRVIWTSIVGIGAPGMPTPKGRFYVREKLENYASPFYGPVALGTSDYSTLSEWPHGGVVGIHGTNEPQLLPGRVSHGCIRVPNAAVLRLARLTPIGTPILIR
jgi:lipoprotein-anchoring transpeptidase ErfK/SrfK